MLCRSQETCQQGAAEVGRQGDEYAVTVARGHGHGVPRCIAHRIEDHLPVTGRVDDLQTIADREAILDLDFSQAVVRVPTDDVADVQAARRLGVAAQIVLALAVVVTLIEAVGVTAVGKAFKRAEQGRVERAASASVVDGLAIALAGTSNVIRRFGASFDLERIDPDGDEPLDMFDGA